MSTSADINVKDEAMKQEYRDAGLAEDAIWADQLKEESEYDSDGDENDQTNGEDEMRDEADAPEGEEMRTSPDRVSSENERMSDQEEVGPRAQSDRTSGNTSDFHSQSSSSLAEVHLFFDSLDAAERWEREREPLHPVEDDDVYDIANESESAVRRIIQAFNKDWKATPEGKLPKGYADWSEQRKMEKWTKWQTEGQRKAEEDTNTEIGQRYREKMARRIVQELLTIHDPEQGYLVGERFDGNEDQGIKCSERLEKILSLICDFARVRARIVNQKTQFNISPFVASPTRYREQDLVTLWGNQTRKPKGKPIQTADDDGRADSDEEVAPQTQQQPAQQMQGQVTQPGPVPRAHSGTGNTSGQINQSASHVHGSHQPVRRTTYGDFLNTRGTTQGEAIMIADDEDPVKKEIKKESGGGRDGEVN